MNLFVFLLAGLDLFFAWFFYYGTMTVDNPKSHERVGALAFIFLLVSSALAIIALALK